MFLPQPFYSSPEEADRAFKREMIIVLSAAGVIGTAFVVGYAYFLHVFLKALTAAPQVPAATVKLTGLVV